MATPSSRLSRALTSRLSRLRRQAPDPVEPEQRRDDPVVELLFGSTLFDHDWYSLCLGRSLRRRAAARHYLASGRAQGLTPHPLFSPELVARQLGPSNAAEDPFVVYLTKSRFELEVHPLLDVAAYLDQNPDAGGHPAGPLGHYAERGAAQGVRVNGWYRPDPEAEPRGIVDWLYAEAGQWSTRRLAALPTWGRGKARSVADAGLGPVDDPRVGTTTVVLVAERDADEVRRSVDSLLAQTTTDWQLLVLQVSGGVDPWTCAPAEDNRVQLIDGSHATVWAARNRGILEATGQHVAFMVAGDEWLPGRLSSVRQALLDSGGSWVHDCARDQRPDVVRRHAARHGTRERLLAGQAIELGTLVVSRELAVSLGGFDESLRSGHGLDFTLRLSEVEESVFAPRLGVTLDQAERRDLRKLPDRVRPWVEFEELASANDTVLNSHLIDWVELSSREVAEDRVSVLIPTSGDWKMTRAAVESIAAAREPGVRTEVIVIDNGSGLVTAAALAALPHEFEDVRVLSSPVNLGFALGSNLGMTQAGGAMVVFLNNDTEVQPGWLAPLREALRDVKVLGAQSLLLYPDGTVQSAGIVFPRGGGIPHMLLTGFPVEDTAGLEADAFHAVTGAALAMRFPDVVSLRGFDPVFRNGMEDVDLCLRLSRLRAGHFVVRPTSRVTHHESQTPGRMRSAMVNRRVLLDRWEGQLPEDDVEAWARHGFDVVGHEIRIRDGSDQRLCTARPVLTRPGRLTVQENLPSLRWAIKSPAPAGQPGERWGDTHFARHLAHALRGLGQEVVIDRRPAFHRPSAHLDDVVLLLRGLAPYTPLLDRVNLMWLISHPDELVPSEHVGWDRVFVASNLYAETLAQSGVPAVPLLQATDPSVFHPDLAEPDSGHDVLFVGNSRGQARPLVMAAVDLGLPLSVFGDGWDRLIPERFVSGRCLPNAEVGAAYRSAGIVLNDHWADMSAHGFFSNRLFDAVAAGARVVTDHVPGVEDVFGDAVQVARTPAELADLVNSADRDAIFGTDETRRGRAARVAAEHSFAARATVLLEEATRIRAARGFR